MSTPTPEERAAAAANIFNANKPGHFPGRPLFEGLVAAAIREAVAAEREACAKRMENIVLDVFGRRVPLGPLLADAIRQREQS